MTTDVALPSDKVAAQRADFLGQATAVEQARAVAEVQAAVIVAQQVPRDINAAEDEMREACKHLGLAERAFYKYPRGGQSITGASIHLAKELARCFGNVQYGIVELRRDDTGRYSEMQAWAWDVQRNTRASQTFVVPHKRDKKGGPPEDLTDLRDIYENSANQGARRLREQIFSILPKWFTAEAEALCLDTLAKGGGGKTLAQQVADAVKAFEDLGVKRDRLEVKLGPRGKWTAIELAHLRVSHGAIRQGTVTVDEEFPPVRVTADEITQGDSTPIGKAGEGDAAAATANSPAASDDDADALFVDQAKDADE